MGRWGGGGGRGGSTVWTRKNRSRSYHHWNRLKGRFVEICERWSGAHICFPERVNTILAGLNWTTITSVHHITTMTAKSTRTAAIAALAALATLQ